MDSHNITRKHVLFCNCGGERIDTSVLSAIQGKLPRIPTEVTCFSDLCGLVANKSPELKDIINDDTEYLVIGCYRRTMDLLLSMTGIKQPFTFEHINMVETTSEKAIAMLDEFSRNSSSAGGYNELKEDSGWPSWFPVIDYSRCSACGQCADFCLFGVYGKSGGQINVVNPKGCKNNCPACARICPVSAIVFPKYKHGGAVGGSDDIDEKAEQQRQSADIADFLGSDIYSALEKRKAKRKSIIREEAMRKAIQERDIALNEE